MGISRTFSIGLNALPGFVSIKTSDYTSVSYAQTLLKQAQIDDQKRYDNLLILRNAEFINNFSPLSETLKIIEAESVLSSLPTEAASRLQKQQEQLIERYLLELPFLEDEKIESLKLGVLTSPSFSFPSGTLVVTRSSNLAEIQFLIPWIRIERKHGIPVFYGLDIEQSSEAFPRQELKCQPVNLKFSIEDFKEYQHLTLNLKLLSIAQNASFWDYISSIGSCVIWAAPAPWNAIGAGVITALRLFFGDDSGSGQTLVDAIYKEVAALIAEQQLNIQTAVFVDYTDKLKEIKGLIDNYCPDKPLSNDLIHDQHWLEDGISGLPYQFDQLNRATNVIYQSKDLLDPDETLGYHSAYVMGVMFQVQVKGMIAKIQAQFASNIGNCNPPNLDVDNPEHSIEIQDTSQFLEETRKFYEEYIKFKVLCVGYTDKNQQLQPGKYQEINKLAHDIWYNKVRAISGLIYYEVRNMYNETWWRYGTWVNVNEKPEGKDAFNKNLDDDLVISDDNKKKAEDLYKNLKDKDDASFWQGLIDYEKSDNRLSQKTLIYFCQYVKAQHGFEPQKWPIYSELFDILNNITYWEDPANYVNGFDQPNCSPFNQYTEWWLTQVTNTHFAEHIWWNGPGDVDDDKKTPQPLCREVAAEILELFLTKQIRTFVNNYYSRQEVLDIHRVESDRHIHNICCTDQYEISFTDHPDQVIKDRNDKLTAYLNKFNLNNMIKTAQQIHDSVYSVSSLMCPCPPDNAPSIQEKGNPPNSFYWQAGNTVFYRYSFRNDAGPSPASPESQFLIPSHSTGVQLTLDLDPFNQATQFLVFRKITDAKKNVLEDRPIGGGKIKPNQTEPLSFIDYC